MRFITKFLTALEKSSTFLGVFVFVVMAIIAFIGVIMRYVINDTWSWTIEILPLMMAWGVFLGLASVTRDNSHIRVTFFAEKILGEKRAVQAWTAMENVLGIGLCAFFTRVSYLWVRFSYRIGGESVGDIRYPIWVPQVALIIGMALLTIFYTERLVKQIISWRTSPIPESEIGEEGGGEVNE